MKISTNNMQGRVELYVLSVRRVYFASGLGILGQDTTMWEQFYEAREFCNT